RGHRGGQRARRRARGGAAARHIHLGARHFPLHVPDARPGHEGSGAGGGIPLRHRAPRAHRGSLDVRDVAFDRNPARYRRGLAHQPGAPAAPTRRGRLTRQVLFVCTGNVFRSLTAEYALRAALHPRTEFLVASAGTDDRAQAVPQEIVDYLRQKNFDVSSHRRRTLTRQLVDAADVVIAISLDHRDFIRVRFGRRVPVFLECCAHRSEALLDLHEAVSDNRTNQAAALAYIRTTIDRIVELTPLLACRIDTLLGDHPQP